MWLKETGSEQRQWCRGQDQLISQLNSIFPISNYGSKLIFLIEYDSQAGKQLRISNQTYFETELKPKGPIENLSNSGFYCNFWLLFWLGFLTNLKFRLLKMLYKTKIWVNKVTTTTNATNIMNLQQNKPKNLTVMIL